MTDPTESLPETWAEADAQAGTEQTSEESAAGLPAGQQDQVSTEQESTEPTLPDLSFLPEDSQQTMAAILASAEPEQAQALIEKIKGGFMSNAKFTQLRQKDKERIHALEDKARDGEQWATLKQDENAMRLFVQQMQQTLGNGQDSNEELPDDLFIRDPNEAVGTLEERFSRLIDQKLSGFQQQLEAKNNAPKEHANSLREAVNEWYDEQANGISEEVVVKATQEMSKKIGNANLTPQLVTALLPDYVDIVQRSAAATQQQAANQSKRESLQQARAASPRGGVGAAAPTGKDFKTKLKDKMEELGRPLSLGERADLSFDGIKETLGESEEGMRQRMEGKKRP